MVAVKLQIEEIVFLNDRNGSVQDVQGLMGRLLRGSQVCSSNGSHGTRARAHERRDGCSAWPIGPTCCASAGAINRSPRILSRAGTRKKDGAGTNRIGGLSSNGTENRHKLVHASSTPAVWGSRSGLSSPLATVSGSVKVIGRAIDVLVPERRQSGDILRPDLVTFGSELVHGCVHVDRVPEHDEVDDQPECSKLIVLALAVALAKFAALAVENDACELVTSLAAVELYENAPAIAFVVDETQQVECLYQAAQFRKCVGEPGRTVVHLERASGAGGADDAKLQRAGEAQQVVPVFGE